jgi:hypothetical protein
MLKSTDLVGFAAVGSALYLGMKAIGSQSASNALENESRQSTDSALTSRLTSMASAANMTAVGYGVGGLVLAGLGVYFFVKR